MTLVKALNYEHTMGKENKKKKLSGFYFPESYIETNQENGKKSLGQCWQPSKLKTFKCKGLELSCVICYLNNLPNPTFKITTTLL